MIVINSRFLTQNITGVQRFAIEISLRLKKALGNEVLFLSPNNIVQTDYAKQLDAQVIGKRTGHLWEQIDLPLYLHKIGKPLLINLANMAPILYSNKISTIHDVAFLAFPQTFSKGFLYSYRFLIPKILKTSKHIITVSNFSKFEIMKAYQTKESQISVVYNAVNNDFSYKENKTLKQEKYFLAVSSLNYRKNFKAVLQAFEIYTKSKHNEKLFIIGDIQNSNFKGINIEDYKNHPQIKFLGRVSDKELIEYYSNAIGFIYPSLYEGFGIPPLEAQKCNCPVLLSDISPLKEVFKDSGIYCNPYDINDIATKMAFLVENTDVYIQKGTLNTQRFSWDKSVESLISIIQKIN